jgi:predicted ATP-dependent serine protease
MKINVTIDDIPFGTSIQDVKVPDVLKKRIPTGLEYFDAVIGGEGFTPSMVTLFTGTPGCGKTTMMLSLLQILCKVTERKLSSIRLKSHFTR